MSLKPTYEDLEQKVQELEEKTESLVRSEEALRTTLEERIRFEKLLSDFSAIFVNMPANKVDGEIEGVLERIGEILGIDRSSFVQLSKELGQIQITHTWAAEGIEPWPHIIPSEYFPWLTDRMLRREIVAFSSPDELPKEAAQDRRTLQRGGQKSGLVIPYFVEGTFLFAISFGTVHSRRSWPEDLIQRLNLLGEVISNALIRKQADLELCNAFSEIKELKDRLQQENIYLRKEIKTIRKHPEIIGESEDINDVLRKIEEVANTNSTVLILGETGTGKELVAHAIHDLSSRKSCAMVMVNCAALPATLVESELFGREKGAYTGALSRQVGRFEIADGSTIFLDEIGELPMELQVKLLRVLQEGQFERLGSSKTISIDVRVITSTNRDLEKAIQEGKFREDLYYRLNVYPIRIPPLREHPEDVLPLTWAFVKKFGDTMGKRIDTISRNSLEAMQSYSWPGNIRELRNVIERAMITCKGRNLILEVPVISKTGILSNLTLEESERRHILSVLKSTQWRIRGKNRAAEILGLKPTTLYSRMKKLGLQRPKK